MDSTVSRTVLYGESIIIVRPLLPCCGARKTLTLDGARLRFSTAATRPSPLHPPPAARRRAPPRRCPARSSPSPPKEKHAAGRAFPLSSGYEKDGIALLADGFELSEIIPPQKQIHPRHCFHKTVSFCLR